MLRPGGAFHLHVPCEGDALSLWRWLPGQRGPRALKRRLSGHIHAFRRADVFRMLETAGFEVVRERNSLHLAGNLADVCLFAGLGALRRFSRVRDDSGAAVTSGTVMARAAERDGRGGGGQARGARGRPRAVGGGERARPRAVVGPAPRLQEEGLVRPTRPNARYRLALAIDRRLGTLLCATLVALKPLMRRPSAAQRPEDVKRILLVKFWGMGSIVLVSSVFREARRLYPNARVDVLTLSENLGLLSLYPRRRRAPLARPLARRAVVPRADALGPAAPAARALRPPARPRVLHALLGTVLVPRGRTPHARLQREVTGARAPARRRGAVQLVPARRGELPEPAARRGDGALAARRGARRARAATARRARRPRASAATPRCAPTRRSAAGGRSSW